jgi:hypothetical protein
MVVTMGFAVASPASATLGNCRIEVARADTPTGWYDWARSKCDFGTGHQRVRLVCTTAPNALAVKTGPRLEAGYWSFAQCPRSAPPQGAPTTQFQP